MEPDKLLAFATDNLSQYFQVVVATLVRPVSRFEPIPEPTSERPPDSKGRFGSRLDPRLFAFMVLSVIIGVTLNSLVPAREPPPTLLTAVLATVVVWFAYGTIVHALCKLLRGRGTYYETLSVTLQLFGVLYLLCSFLTLLTGSVVTIEVVATHVRAIGWIGEWIVDSPIMFYFLFQAVLMLIYLPIALRRVHHFGWLRQLALSVPAVAVIVSLNKMMFTITRNVGCQP